MNSSKILGRACLSDEILALRLEKPFDFLAGQYLFIHFENTNHPYSIASSPDKPFLELHIQHCDRHPLGTAFWQHLQTSPSLLISGPEGSAYLRLDSPRDLLFIAGGSGFAPIHSMIDCLMAEKIQKKIRLYWGLRDIRLRYDLPSIEGWHSFFKDFAWTPVLSEAQQDWTGRQGLVHQAVLDDGLILSEYDIYIAGPFPLSHAALCDFSAQQAADLTIYSDALIAPTA